MGDFAELKHSLAALEDILCRLDRIGAGIAAIHVDAAINQLKNNMEVIAEDRLNVADDTAPCPSEYRILSR